MSIPSEILALWKQHATAPFPKGYGGRTVNGMDLSLLDAEITGYIRMYINEAGLDYRKLQSLQERLIGLNATILLLDGEESTYFNRLRELANLVIQETGK
jgi:hypothetical protein